MRLGGWGVLSIYCLDNNVSLLFLSLLHWAALASKYFFFRGNLAVFLDNISHVCPLKICRF